MAGSLNKVVLIGNVGRDPEIKQLDNGRYLANLSIATSETWKDKQDGSRKERTEWHRIVIFNENLVKIVQQYVRKGDKLYIEGALQTRRWTAQDGTDRYSTEVVLAAFNGQIVMLSSKPRDEPGEDREETGQQAAPKSPANGQAAPSPTQAYRPPTNADLDDDIPF